MDWVKDNLIGKPKAIPAKRKIRNSLTTSMGKQVFLGEQDSSTSNSDLGNKCYHSKSPLLPPVTLHTEHVLSTWAMPEMERLTSQDILGCLWGVAGGQVMPCPATPAGLELVCQPGRAVNHWHSRDSANPTPEWPQLPPRGWAHRGHWVFKAEHEMSGSWSYPLLDFDPWWSPGVGPICVYFFSLIHSFFFKFPFLRTFSVT